VLYYERKFKRLGYDLIIGVDEVGRGPLAGPVVAAAVSLRRARLKNRIDDSKKLSPQSRERAFPEITSKAFFGLGLVSEKIIDRLNIEVATSLAMEKAIAQLLRKLKSIKFKRIRVLVDGRVKLNIRHPCTNIIKGDSKSKSIACASILAKVVRDRIMSVYDRIYPQYGFLEHKGYPTFRHRAILRKIGPSLIHRATFHYV